MLCVVGDQVPVSRVPNQVRWEGGLERYKEVSSCCVLDIGVFQVPFGSIISIKFNVLMSNLYWGHASLLAWLWDEQEQDAIKTENRVNITHDSMNACM